MLNPLTEEQRKQYILNKGIVCPHCSSTNIEGESSLDMDSGYILQEIACRDCDARWIDVYKLHDIVPL